jgi:hypothetical protein
MYKYNTKTDNTPVFHSCTNLFQFLDNRAFRFIAAFTVHLIFLWLVIAGSVSTPGAEDLSSARRSKCLYCIQILRELRRLDVNNNDIAKKMTCYFVKFFCQVECTAVEQFMAEKL